MQQRRRRAMVTLLATLVAASTFEITPANAATAQYWYVNAPACDYNTRPPWSMTVGSATGWFECGVRAMDVMWADGHHEIFGVGTDGAVWHIVPGGTSWQSLGGVAVNVVSADYYTPLSLPTITVLGSDYDRWCNSYWPGGGWGGWFFCN